MKLFAFVRAPSGANPETSSRCERFPWEAIPGAPLRECRGELARSRRPLKRASGVDPAVGNWGGMPWSPAEAPGGSELRVVPPEGRGSWHVFTLRLSSQWWGPLPGATLCQPVQQLEKGLRPCQMDGPGASRGALTDRACCDPRPPKVETALQQKNRPKSLKLGPFQTLNGGAHQGPAHPQSLGRPEGQVAG